MFSRLGRLRARLDSVLNARLFALARPRSLLAVKSDKSKMISWSLPLSPGLPSGSTMGSSCESRAMGRKNAKRARRERCGRSEWGSAKLLRKRGGRSESRAEVLYAYCCSRRRARLGVVEGAHASSSAVSNRFHPTGARYWELG